tara:strand:+ start:729 stop:2309 length:1581 start_codon:yes stop_codon:yes gene_type:complete
LEFLNSIIEEVEINNFWQEYRNFCTDIDSVEIDALLNALPKLHKKLENNLSSRQLDAAIENLTKKNASIGEELFNKILTIDNPHTFPQLANILGGLYFSNIKSAISKTQGLILSDNDILKKIGISTIVKFDLSKEKCSTEFLHWINTILFDLSNDEDCNKLWPSIFFVSRNKRKYLENSERIIENLATIKKIEIQLELLSYLSYNVDLETEFEKVEKYLPNLLHIDINYGGAYSQLSYFLETLSKKQLQIILDFLNSWIELNIENARKIGFFTHLLNTLFDEHYQEFQKFYTSWLNHDSPNFHIAIFEMCRAGEFREISQLTLSEEILRNYSIYDIEYITYKILAYVYDKDSSLSLIYSILEQKSNEKEIVLFLSEIFVDYLIFNYYSAIEFLNKKMKIAKPKLKKIIQDIIKEGEKSYSAYSELETLKEFAPSERRLNEYYRIQNKKFNKSYKEIGNNSNSFLNFAKNIHYRAGKSIFSKYRGEYTQDMTPALISHSTEMPRGEFIDPIGQAKLRLFWQNFKRRQ